MVGGSVSDDSLETEPLGSEDSYAEGTQSSAVPDIVIDGSVFEKPELLRLH